MDPEIVISEDVQRAADVMRLDSRETAFFARELEHIKTTTYDVRYPALRAREFVPISHDADPADEKITYRQWDAFGMATIVSHWADDLPHIELSGKEFSTPVVEIGDAYGYSKNELRAAAKVGRPLTSEKANKAREFIERRIDDILAYGVPEKDMPGFTNHPNVPIATLPTGAWSGATAENILADMNYLVTQMVTNTKQTEKPDTLLLPTALYMLVSQKVAGNQLADTVLGIFLKTNPFIKTVETWVKLDTAAADGSGRVICYARDPRVLQGEIPMEFTQEPPEARGRGFEVQCTARIGGTVIRYPLALIYADNAM